LGTTKGSFDAVGLILSETEYHCQDFQGWHSHENTHLSLVINGGNREDRVKADIDVRPGKLLFTTRTKDAATVIPLWDPRISIWRSAGRLWMATRSPSKPFMSRF